MGKKSFNKRIFVICVAFLLAIAAGIIFAISKSHNKPAVIGFYDFDAEYAGSFKKLLETDSSFKYEFKSLSEKEVLSKNITKKINILISPNSAITQRLAYAAIPLSDSILARIPQTIKNSELYKYNEQTVIMPLAIDQFETSILSTTYKRYKMKVPQTVNEISDFAGFSKVHYETPIGIAGGEDININSLFSLLVDSYGGKDSYFNMVQQLKTTVNFDDFYEYKIGGNADPELKVKDLLNIIKGWQENRYMPDNWKQATAQNNANLIDDNRVTLNFMNLSEHRSKPFPNIAYFETIEFPSETKAAHVSVQPVITAMAFKNTEAIRIGLNRLSTEKNQGTVSLITKLGPATLTGTACDKQADDARFFAATTEGGPVPDLGSLAFEKQADRRALAQAIRNWF